MAASHVPSTGVLAHNPGMCPDWELNWQPFGSQADTQSTEPGQMCISSYKRTPQGSNLQEAFFAIQPNIAKNIAREQAGDRTHGPHTDSKLVRQQGQSGGRCAVSRGGEGYLVSWAGLGILFYDLDKNKGQAVSNSNILI